ncbi:MAG: hypothetical protein E4G98_05235 [Promethearchaeota archaeon]|nr:MAG: hypothetical protein E4G98_05235 [Candidatus Lokiarchaeota archaeon]
MSIAIKKSLILKSVAFFLGAIVILPIVFFGVWLVYNDVRPPPDYDYDPVLDLEHWTIVEAGDDPTEQHKSNTDMIFYNNSFYVIHAQTKWHLQDPNGALVIRTSPDATEGSWTEIARITLPQTDVRDPKFANIGGRLFVYFLPNYNFDPGPNTTFYTYSDDGFHTFPAPMELKFNVSGTIIGGWNIWRPKTRDNVSWYVLASGRKSGVAFSDHDADVSNTITVLFNSTDGIGWSEVSEVYTRWGNGEPCLEFLPNGEFRATLRVGAMGVPGYALGNPHGCTVIATSSNNHQNWTSTPDFQTRLDGATLFTLEGRIFAVGRNHLGPSKDLGNHFRVKRTTFYEVKADRLVFLFDLPSSGDTAYTGVVVKDGIVYTCYYTAPIIKEYAWFVGICFLTKTDIRMASVSATGLVAYADSIQGEG